MLKGDVIRNLNEQENQSWYWGHVTEKNENDGTITVRTGKKSIQALAADDIEFEIG